MRRNSALAALADIVGVLAFCAVGRRSHAEGLTLARLQPSDGRHDVDHGSSGKRRGQLEVLSHTISSSHR
jgi:hypothetical protein